jgi:hypothetical protein
MLFFQQFLETPAGCLFGDDIGVKTLGRAGPLALRRLFDARLVSPNQPPVSIKILNPTHFSHLPIASERPWRFLSGSDFQIAEQRREGQKQACLFHRRIRQFCPFTPVLRRSPAKVTGKVEKSCGGVFRRSVGPQGERKWSSDSAQPGQTTFSRTKVVEPRMDTNPPSAAEAATTGNTR